MSRTYSSRPYGNNPSVRGLGVRYLVDFREGRLRKRASATVIQVIHEMFESRRLLLDGVTVVNWTGNI